MQSTMYLSQNGYGWQQRKRDLMVMRTITRTTMIARLTILRIDLMVMRTMTMTTTIAKLTIMMLTTVMINLFRCNNRERTY